MSSSPLPPFPYGAVYFRKSNPPRSDWERDYATAAEDGMNVFRHWFLWSAIETSPGVFDWEDYDRQLDLAAQNGIQTIIAEMMTLAPEWAYRRYAHARFETHDGRRLDSRMQGSCVVGGAPGLCLDNEDWRGVAERFLRALVTRYRDHPALGGYDIWNECGYGADVCYCPATAGKFREWLMERYGDLESLGRAWHRYSFSEWADVTPPRVRGPYPDTLDWLEFRIENSRRLLRWRVGVVRELDPDHPVTAHGTVGSITQMATNTLDDWRAAAEVDSYGLTWVACRKGDAPWQHWHAVDLTRAAARGKAFWHAEAQGGPLWMQPQLPGRPREDGRIPEPEDLRLWHLTSFAAGATGLLYPRWRPLLDGPLYGAFGPYGMDGQRTPRSQMTSWIARWATDPAQADLWASRPVRGEVGILLAPETELYTYAQQGSTDLYARSMHGAYQGFFDLNVRADWVRLGQIDEYKLLYLPFPVMLKQATADALRAWVQAGGVLVAEGCPGYHGDRGQVGASQPNLGLDQLFGARESYVEFTPDLLGDLEFSLNGTRVRGGLYLQAYEPTSGTPVGWYDDGRVAAVDHAYGQGKTRLLGTMCGAGYDAHPKCRSPELFGQALVYGGAEQHVTCSDPRVKARLHDGPGGTYLWVANPTWQPIPVRLSLGAAWGPYGSARTLWGAQADAAGHTVTLTAGARDVAVMALE